MFMVRKGELCIDVDSNPYAEKLVCDGCEGLNICGPCETYGVVGEKIEQLQKEIAYLEQAFFAEQSLTLADRKGQLKAYQDIQSQGS